jgi:signal transduction histidine kinase
MPQIYRKRHDHRHAAPVISLIGKQEVMITITDTGTGIAPEIKKTFLPFSQADGSPTRKTGGTARSIDLPVDG